jgi:hypothetical protein
MPLPKISQPLFSLNLPSTGKAIRYRPFTVREEKLLMIAQESSDRKDVINTYKQLINNCCVDPIDVDKLASFDIEYFFIALRSKSVSNIAKVLVTDKDDGEQYEVEVNLDKVEIVKKQEIQNKFMLTDSIGVVLKYPTFETLVGLDPEKADVLTILRGCIDQIFEGEDVYDTSNYTKAELDEFIMSFNKQQMEKIQEFFESMPKVVAKAKYVAKDNQVKEITIEGLDNFF